MPQLQAALLCVSMFGFARARAALCIQELWSLSCMTGVHLVQLPSATARSLRYASCGKLTGRLVLTEGTLVNEAPSSPADIKLILGGKFLDSHEVLNGGDAAMPGLVLCAAATHHCRSLTNKLCGRSQTCGQQWETHSRMQL